MPENKLINNQTNLERSPSGDILLTQQLIGYRKRRDW